MEVPKEQKLRSKLETFEIPIHRFERDMESESAKEKKEEILDIFTNYNNLRSEEEYEEIKYNLHDAFKEGDLILIKIYLSEKIKNDSNDLTFKIDKINKTASLFGVSDETSMKSLFHQISKLFHILHLIIVTILQNLNYKQLNQKLFQNQKLNKFLFHQIFQKD